LEVLSRFGLWRDFLNDNIQATISAFRLIKNMSINPKSVEFHECHAKPHLICFFFNTISKTTKEIFAKICWQLKTPTRTLKCTRYIMQMRSYLYASDFPFKNFCKIAHHTETIRKKCLRKSNDAYSLSIRVQSTITHFSIFTSYPGARFSKALESFRARKAIFRSSVSKNRKVYTPETSCMKGTSLHL